MLTMISLFALLLLLLIISYSFSYKKIILTPQFAFIAGFLLSVGYALFWVDEWDLELSEKTFIVLLGGISLFLAVSIVIHYIGLKYNFVWGKEKAVFAPSKIGFGQENNADDTHNISVEKWKLILFLVLQIIVFAGCVYYLVFKVGGGLSGAITAVNGSTKGEDEAIKFPFVLRVLRELCFASGFVWSYLMAHSLVYKYKCHKVLLLFNIILSTVNYLLGGARRGFVQLIIAFVVMLYFIWGEKTQWRKKIKISTILKVVALALVLILLYQYIGKLLGRKLSLDIGEYIATYISAEIKNLDTFIREGVFGQGGSFSRTQTFAHLANQIQGQFGLPIRALKYDQPYRYVNGYYLGNVYTTFWAFLYDAGFTGLIGYTSLMAIILQVIYLKVIKVKKKVNKIRLSLIVYSYLCLGAVFSFFTNWFYAIFFNRSFLYCLIFWILLKIYIENVRIKTYNARLRPQRAAGE